MDLCLINSWRRGVDTTVSKQTTVGRRGGGTVDATFGHTIHLLLSISIDE